jgi:hypothetical protein
MDISGTIQFYDSSSSFSRATMDRPFNMAAPHPQIQHINSFNPDNGAPAFANHIQQQLLPPTSFVEQRHSAPPAIKSEAQWNDPGNSLFVAPQYLPVHAFSGAPSNNMVVAHPQMQQNNPFSFAPYMGAGQNRVIPAYANNYIQQRPLPRQTEPDTSYARNIRQGFIEEHHSQSPPIKAEPQWSGQVHSPSFPSANTKTVATTSPTKRSKEVNFGTEVDTLMKAIQAKTQTITPQKPSSADQSRPVVGVSRTPPYVQAASQARAYGSGDLSQFTQKDVQEEASPKGGKKQYQCTIENCTKSFYQKTHLDIHERAHTGVKPYVSNLLLLSKSGL